MVNGQWSMVNLSKFENKIHFYKIHSKKFAPKEIDSKKFNRKNSLSLVFKKLLYNQRTFMFHHA